MKINNSLKDDKKEKASRKGGLNPRPFAYEATALPLSYFGQVKNLPSIYLKIDILYL